MNIEFLLDDLRHQVIESESFLNSIHDRLLLNLPYREKIQVRELFCKWEWNIGSVRVLHRLQKTKLITATEYITFVISRNPDEALLILNDIFEAEIILLADIFANIDTVNSRALQIEDLLKDCIKQICCDLSENPSCITINYIKEIQNHLTKENFESVKLMHLDIFLDQSGKSSIENAYEQQQQWAKEMKEIQSSTLHNMIKTLVQSSECRGETFQRLIQKASLDNFQCLKWYLYFLHYCISETNDSDFYVAEELKYCANYTMKELFKKSVEEKNINKFQLMLLTVRTICKSNENILGNYATWYKCNISDMKYFLKNEEFDFVLSILVELVPIEQDLSILKIHAKTHIAVPPLRNDNILNYKQLCNSKILNFPSRNIESKADSDVILID